MAEITVLSIVGDWRIVVQSRNAAWDQRVLVTNTADGTQTLQGNPGHRLDVYGNDQSPWQLKIQHNDGEHGWQDSWLGPKPRVISGATITQVVESEDITTESSDRDFDDLVIRLEKLGMVDQPSRPYAVLPTSMHMMPEGIFEASLGRYFMGVRVRNIWTKVWPVSAQVGLTDRSRAWLAAAGVQVVNAWSSADQAALGQEVIDDRVRVGALQPWESRLIYFKVDVTNAAPRKHDVEVSVSSPPVTEPLSHLNRNAKQPMMVSRTTYDAEDKVFVSQCDRGRMDVAVRELAVDYNTFKRAIGKARELFRDGGSTGAGPGDGGRPSGREGCSPRDLERLRRQLLEFLHGKRVDICDIWRQLQCCCAGGGFGEDGDGDGDDWTGQGGSGMEFFSFPTVMDYRVQYAPSYLGQFGPIPFDDPWWKCLLMIVAIILTIAAAVSAAADLASRGDDVVIGFVADSRLEDVDNLIDAAIVILNGDRSLTPEVFSYLDAESGELNTVPVDGLGGLVHTPGTTMTNAEIAAALADFAANPDDPTAQANVRVFKSGARTGVTFGRMTRVQPLNRDDDGVFRTFVNQLRIEEDPTMPNALSNSGDSGSLWIHLNSRAIVALNHAGNRTFNTAHGSRIEDVMNELRIRFA